jgi:hypothetical protein|tara:strand:- start:490 stop:1128 length:639 start_codon:yes stop_codon:yes gene_type:complete
MKKSWITYEWSLEYINKWGDIVDTDHSDTLSRLWRVWRDWEVSHSKPYVPVPDGEPVRVELSLVRVSAHVEAKDYAYVVDGQLATKFEESEKVVPARYLVEFEKYNEEAKGEAQTLSDALLVGTSTLDNANKVQFVTAKPITGGYRIEAVIDGNVEILKKKSTKIPACIQIYDFKINGNFRGDGFGGYCTFSKSINSHYRKHHLKTLEVFVE